MLGIFAPALEPRLPLGFVGDGADWKEAAIAANPVG